MLAQSVRQQRAERAAHENKVPGPRSIAARSSHCWAAAGVHLRKGQARRSGAGSSGHVTERTSMQRSGARRLRTVVDTLVYSPLLSWAGGGGGLVAGAGWERGDGHEGIVEQGCRLQMCKAAPPGTPGTCRTQVRPKVEKDACGRASEQARLQLQRTRLACGMPIPRGPCAAVPGFAARRSSRPARMVGILDAPSTRRARPPC